MSVKHNKDGGGNAEIKKELQEVKLSLIHI